MLQESRTYMTFTKVGYEDVLLVVSAMGKTTNALEIVKKLF
jgi:aspartate kinase